MSQPLNTQVAVIGGGPGGYAAAFAAADLGLEVTLIDLEPNPGGVCLYRGCIPSKALLHCAKVIKDAEEAAQWGIHFERLRIDPLQHAVPPLPAGVTVGASLRGHSSQGEAASLAVRGHDRHRRSATRL